MGPVQKSDHQPHFSVSKNICVDFMKAYQDQEVEAMILLCNDKATVHFKPLGEHGLGTVRQLGRNLWSSLIDCFPDIGNTVHSIVSEEGNVLCRVSIAGTQLKEFAGIPSHGGRFDSEHIFVFELDDDHQIKHIDISWDHDDFVNQLAGPTS